jgi:chromate transporter
MRPVPLDALARYFLRLGTFGFGGPIALTAAMERDLVEQRGWISPAEYKEGLALAQLSPGPLAAQLCFYIGYIRAGVLGATVSGLAFVLPSFIMVLALGWAYVRYGGLAWMQAVFYGVGAAVIGIITRSAYGLTRRTLGRDALLWTIFVALAITTAITGREIVWLILLGGALVWLVRAPPAALRRRGTAAEGGSALLLLQILGFFAYAGTFVFGSGLAIVPFLHGGVVLEHGWLTERQFLDAVAVALITPGPVVITTGFIGYLVAGVAGACVAAGATFLPAFLFTILPAPYFHRYGKRPWLIAVVSGITAAAIGAIAGAVIVLARHSIVDPTTALIAAGVLALGLMRWKIPEPIIVVAAALIGLAVFPGASAGAQQETGCSLARSGRGPVRIPAANAAGVDAGESRRDGPAVLRPIADIPLPGRPVRFDYQSLDPASGRLYISHMNDGHVEVFDTRSSKVVGRVADTPRVTGVLVVPELEKVYASVAGRHNVAVIDPVSLRTRATLGPIGFPDGLAYAPEAKRVFVSDESGGGELIIDGRTDKVVARIPLGGEAGNTNYDAGSGCILVAVQTLNQIVAIDPASARVVGRYVLEGADHPHGMYVDAPGRLLFVANQGNATLQMVDLSAMQVTETLKVGEDPDVLAFDPEWRRLYVATEGGGLWVYRVRGRSLVIEAVLKIPHAHTVAVDGPTHLVYLPLENVGGRPVLRILRGVRP